MRVMGGKGRRRGRWVFFIRHTPKKMGAIKMGIRPRRELSGEVTYHLAETHSPIVNRRGAGVDQQLRRGLLTA